MASLRTACAALRWNTGRPVLRSSITVSPRCPNFRSQVYRGFRSSPRPQQRQQYNKFKSFRQTASSVYVNYPRTTVAGIAGSGGIWLYNHDSVPVTNRWRFNIVPAEAEKAIGDANYQSIVSEYRGKVLPESHPYSQMVKRVVDRLLPASGIAGDGEWTITVINEPGETNAFVIPGGHVFVFTGILDIAQDEDAVAAVLSHEIAHNVAHHAAERMSKAFPLLIAAVGIAYFLDTSLQLSQALVGYLLELPSSRKHEAEADHIGLLMMAQSCYDPEAAVRFWGTMQAVEERKGGSPPQFLSTHPSSKNRQEWLQKMLPQAQQLMEQNNCSTTSRYMDDFRSTFQAPQTQQPRRPGKDVLDDWLG